MGRLIVVSNRLPYTIQQTDEGVRLRQSSGGLVSAIKSYFERTDKQRRQFDGRVWIGSLDATEAEWEAAQEGFEPSPHFAIEPVLLDAATYSDYYNGFSNSTLWPLFHYFPSLAGFKKEYFDAYRQINQEFAEAVRKVYQPGDVVWVHDYQLMLLPQLLRESLNDASIGFFLHIPFPSYEIFRLLPTRWKRALLQGLLGADLVGFHTHDYAQHFIQSCKMVLKVENQFADIIYNERVIKTDLFPIGIDYQKFRDAITNEEVVHLSSTLVEKFAGIKKIFSVDRLDYTKGLEYRLEGYEAFLTKYPEWKEKVIFILNIIPSRDLIQTYSRRKSRIEEMVSGINGRFSTLHWQPLIYRYNHLSFEELCSLYQTADVALITPLRDGMNLVAKEYVASCIDEGVLVLSEFTGAASELSEAVLVNPTDMDEVAEGIETALQMHPIEQRSRLSNMQRRIANYDVFNWTEEFLQALDNAKREQDTMEIRLLHESDISGLINEARHASKRCFLLDYDGTLSPLQNLPSMAVPTPEALDLLKELTSNPQNEVVIISGRDAKTLETWLGQLPLNLIAEHGAALRYRDGEWEQQASMSNEWKDKIKPLMQLFVNRCAGSFVEEKQSTLAWHYRNTHPDLGFNRSRELRNSLLQLTGNTPLQVIDGNKVLEVRMVGMDKGTTALNMLKTLSPDFVLCIGDDVTDEDMFRALADRGHTIKIGRGNTAAQYTMLTQKDVLPLLKRFAQLKPAMAQAEQ